MLFWSSVLPGGGRASMEVEHPRIDPNAVTIAMPLSSSVYAYLANRDT